MEICDINNDCYSYLLLPIIVVVRQKSDARSSRWHADIVIDIRSPVAPESRQSASDGVDSHRYILFGNDFSNLSATLRQ